MAAPRGRSCAPGGAQGVCWLVLQPVCDEMGGFYQVLALTGVPIPPPSPLLPTSRATQCMVTFQPVPFAATAPPPPQYDAVRSAVAVVPNGGSGGLYVSGRSYGGSEGGRVPALAAAMRWLRPCSLHVELLPLQCSLRSAWSHAERRCLAKQATSSPTLWFTPTSPMPPARFWLRAPTLFRWAPRASSPFWATPAIPARRCG